MAQSDKKNQASDKRTANNTADVSSVKRVCLITPGTLPVPATRGGAIETLVTLLMDVNENSHLIDLTVVSIFEPEAEKSASKYRFSKIVFIRNNNPIMAKLYRFLKRFLAKCIPSREWITDMYVSSVFRFLKRSKFDHIVFEGGNCKGYDAFRMIQDSEIIYHLHFNPEDRIDNRCFAKCLAVSGFVADSWCRECDPVSTVEVIHNGIDLSRFQREVTKDERDSVRAGLGFASDDFVVLYCGRIIEVKGVLELLEAIRRVDDAHVRLLIVGSPDFARSSHTSYLDRVQSLVDELGGRVVFTGYVPNEGVYRYSKSADMQVVPSLWEEAAGLVGVEAMAAGLPLVVTRSGGLQEYVPEECSIVVERDEGLVDSLAAAIRRLEGDRQLRERMSEAAVRQAARFSGESFYRAFVDAVGR
ncbi:glycosyltransferase family 4 protein [Bifidobacterium eulemuris]|nr:glycosyltransferase family 4 protein [Bifidobacterium eulemuris]